MQRLPRMLIMWERAESLQEVHCAVQRMGREGVAVEKVLPLYT